MIENDVLVLESIYEIKFITKEEVTICSYINSQSSTNKQIQIGTCAFYPNLEEGWVGDIEIAYRAKHIYPNPNLNKERKTVVYKNMKLINRNINVNTNNDTIFYVFEKQD